MTSASAWAARRIKERHRRAATSLARSGLALIQNDTSTSIVQSGGTIAAGSLVSRLDSLGRTVARGDLTLEYGPDGQVATARRGPSTWSFVYDEAGQRRLKAAGGTPVVAYLDEGCLDESGLSEPVSVGGRVVGLGSPSAPRSNPCK